ncbi:MAG TPA: PhzF family phenazine biosynthesis protein [Candidatus Eisenbacteria bacterium]|jgi:PhzF family phenazine biosynthesis protein
MKIPLFQIDAFASRVFQGNPAAVCPLEDWLPEATMQAIAAENNLAETAFVVGRDGRYQIRWFTPVQEVDLCGHATLASAHVVFETLEPGRREVAFDSRGGALRVSQEVDLLVLDFPAYAPAAIPVPAGIAEAMGRAPRQALSTRDLLLVYDTEEEIRALQPDMRGLLEVDGLGVIASAPGRASDFVSRFFAPKAGILEDPATGSSHCTLVPYWAERLGKPKLHALQLSRRGGELFCERRGERVHLGGRAVRYLEGTIEIGR